MSDPLQIEMELSRLAAGSEPQTAAYETQDYELRSSGGSRATVTVPWSDGLLTDLAVLSADDPDPAVVQRLGDRLAAILAPAGWAVHEAAVRDAVATGRPVHITFRFAAAELYALPWELLTVQSTGQHIGELSGVLLAYTWPDSETTPGRKVGHRLLFAWSAAGGPVPAARQIEQVQAALQEANLAWDPSVDVLPEASPEALVEALERASAEGRPYSALHLLAHGRSTGSSTSLALTDPFAPEPVLVHGAHLRRFLGPYTGSLRLVVLSACQTGDASPHHHAGGLAQYVHRAGVQAVIASRLPLSARGSVQLTQQLYQRLFAEAQPIGAALCGARTAMAKGALCFDWAALQLYARPEDGAARWPLALPAGPGPKPFRRVHRRAYAGRSPGPLVDALRAALRGEADRCLLLTHASGVGATSLVEAAVLPALEAQIPGLCLWIAGQPRPAGRPVLLLADGHLPDQLAQGPDEATLIVLRAGSAIRQAGRTIDGRRLDSLPHASVPAWTAEALTEALAFPYARVGRPVDRTVLNGLVEATLQAQSALTLATSLLARLDETDAALPLGAGLLAEDLLETEALRRLTLHVAPGDHRLRRRLVELLDLEADPPRPRQVHLRDLRPASAAAATDALFRPLIDAHLLAEDGIGGEIVLSLCHPALAAALAPTSEVERAHALALRDLRAWTEDHAAHASDPDEGASYLLSGPRLSEAEALLRRCGEELSDAVHALVAASAAWPSVLAGREVEAAQRHLAAAEGTQAEAALLRQRALVALDGVPRTAPVDEKRAAWQAEDEAEQRQARAELEVEAALACLERALQQVPAHPGALGLLARLDAQRLLEAEARGDRSTARRALARLQRHAQPESAEAALLAGEGWLSLDTEPPSLVHHSPQSEVDRRLVPGPAQSLGPTPLRDLRLPMGSHSLRLDAPGLPPILLPVFLPRGGRLDLGGPLRLPPADDFDPDEVFVAAGPFRSGGDPEAAASLPARTLWVDGFHIGRHPVTNAQWREFLQDLHDAGRTDEAAAATPRERAASPDRPGAPLFRLDEGGRYSLPIDADGHAWHPDWPILMITAHQAQAYLRWRSACSGRAYRLPSELEWEKAARGVDGRRYPWGDRLDPTFCVMMDSHRGPASPAPVTASPADESPYGVRGMGGNAKDLCGDAWRKEGPPIHGDRASLPTADPLPAELVTRGGSWSVDALRCRVAARAMINSQSPTGFITLRLARSACTP